MGLQKTAKIAFAVEASLDFLNGLGWLSEMRVAFTALAVSRIHQRASTRPACPLMLLLSSCV
jgi:hypothetical protein